MNWLDAVFYSRNPAYLPLEPYKWRTPMSTITVGNLTLSRDEAILLKSKLEAKLNEPEPTQYGLRLITLDDLNTYVKSGKLPSGINSYPITPGELKLAKHTGRPDRTLVTTTLYAGARDKGSHAAQWVLAWLPK